MGTCLNESKNTSHRRTVKKFRAQQRIQRRITFKLDFLETISSTLTTQNVEMKMQLLDSGLPVCWRVKLPPSVTGNNVLSLFREISINYYFPLLGTNSKSILRQFWNALESFRWIRHRKSHQQHRSYGICYVAHSCCYSSSSQAGGAECNFFFFFSNDTRK